MHTLLFLAACRTIQCPGLYLPIERSASPHHDHPTLTLFSSPSLRDPSIDTVSSLAVEMRGLRLLALGSFGLWFTSAVWAQSTAAQVSVGTVKGTGKIAKGIGRGIKHIF